MVFVDRRLLEQNHSGLVVFGDKILLESNHSGLVTGDYYNRIIEVWWSLVTADY